MTEANGAAPETQPALARESPALSGQLAVLRSGKHLRRITENLREVETVMLRAEWHEGSGLAVLEGTSRSRLQSLDLMIQELTGLSDILIGIASRLCDEPDQHIEMLVDLPRLQTLAQALRDRQQEATPPQIDLF